MQNFPAPKRARHAVGIVCEACGKHFASSDGFDKHRTSGYLLGTPCHVLDDGHSRHTGGHRTADDVDSHAAKAETVSTNTWYFSKYPKHTPLKRK